MIAPGEFAPPPLRLAEEGARAFTPMLTGRSGALRQRVDNAPQEGYLFGGGRHVRAPGESMPAVLPLPPS